MDYGFYCDIEIYDMQVILQEPKRRWYFPKSDPVQLDPVQLDPVQLDPVQLDPVQLDPMRTDSMRLDPVRTDSIQIDNATTDNMSVFAVLAAMSIGCLIALI